jgi:hypothetical protein
MMKLADAIRLRSNVHIEVRNAATGALLRQIDGHNLVTLAGRNLVRDALSGISVDITHLAVGTGTTAVDASDTAMETEVLRGILTRTMRNSGQVVFDYYLASGDANGSELTEAGLFDAASSGTLFAHYVHAAISKSSSITVTYRWTIDIGAE